VNFDLFTVVPRRAGPERHSPLLEFSSNDRSEDKGASHASKGYAKKNGRRGVVQSIANPPSTLRIRTPIDEERPARGNATVNDGSQPELCCFLLIYRGRRGLSTLVVEATSLADALFRAEELGCERKLFRLAQALGPELAALAQNGGVNRLLSHTDARQLLAVFRSHFESGDEVSRSAEYSAAAE
jgi:hypothetical protein